jgi:hypothetical protein
METFLEIIKYTLPALVVFLTVYFVLKFYFDYKHKEGRQEILRKEQDIILPVRLQAYERMVLFLERISPVQAVFRVVEPDMSPAHLQAALVQAIREEFEHNIAQQIYISPEAWGLVRNAREETVRLINTAFISMNEKSTANDLAKTILENWSVMEKNPVQSAVDYLKNEVRQLFEEA